jgi:sec-independent protein translocase protein TatA
MPNIGPMELAIVVIVALIVFGPKKLPELGSSLGRGMREFKSSISGDDGPERTDKSPLQVDSTTDEREAPGAHAEPTPSNA